MGNAAKVWLLCSATVGWGCGGETLGDQGGAGSGSGGTTAEVATTGPGASEAGDVDCPAGDDCEQLDTGGSSTGAVECMGEAPGCVDFDGVGCSDLVLGAPCVGGVYECQEGTIDVTQCVCFNNEQRPICLESNAGECSDIMLPSVCEGRPGRGGWVCGEGSTPMEECGGGSSSTG